MQADVVISHRKDIQRTRSLAAKLLSEVENVTDNLELFEQLGELLIDTSPRENGKVDQNEYKRMEALNRVLDMSGRIDSCKKLSETLKTLIGLEREAFSIDEKTQTEEKLEDFLEKLDQ
jgi:chaperonin cofactor prefoldin